MEDLKDEQYWESKIKEIADKRGDDEAQHSLEDDLHAEFIEYVSYSARVPSFMREYAKLVLSTKDMKFARWCA